MARANYYEVLGVRAEAAAAEIQRAYRTLAKKLHPDVSKEPDAQKRFAAVARAYEVLSNPAKRREYDRRLEQRGAAGESEGRSAARGHYSWRNIATEQTPERNGANGARERTELDELYDTFFGKRA